MKPSKLTPATTNAGSGRSRFRLFAATGMLAFIVAAVSAIILFLFVFGNRLGFRNETVMSHLEQLTSPVPTDPTAMPILASLIKTMLDQHTLATLISFAALMLLFAFLLRKVVLAGLRD